MYGAVAIQLILAWRLTFSFSVVIRWWAQQQSKDFLRLTHSSCYLLLADWNFPFSLFADKISSQLPLLLPFWALKRIRTLANIYVLYKEQRWAWANPLTPSLLLWISHANQSGGNNGGKEKRNWRTHLNSQTKKAFKFGSWLLYKVLKI